MTDDGGEIQQSCSEEEVADIPLTPDGVRIPSPEDIVFHHSTSTEVTNLISKGALIEHIRWFVIGEMYNGNTDSKSLLERVVKLNVKCKLVRISTAQELKTVFETAIRDGLNIKVYYDTIKPERKAQYELIDYQGLASIN